jgi:hypothetical protein
VNRPGVALLSLAVVVVAAACSEAPRPPDPRLWTIFDLQPRSADPTAAVAADAGLPGGVPVAQVLGADGATLAVRPALDVYEAGYVTTEVWAHYDRVWIQPMYVLVTGWEADGPVPVRVGGVVQPIFSVGPKSGFYSPFWQTIYVQVPADVSPQALGSVRAIIDSGYPLVPGPGRTVSLVPDGTTVPASPDIGAPRAGQGWLDAAPISFLDFGTGMFTWDEDGVVAETPLYHFVFPTADGTYVPLDVPAVAAGGPRGSNLAPPTLNHQIRYAAYWRLYAVKVPLTAAVFAPPAQTEVLRPGLLEALRSTVVPVVEASGYSPDVATDPSVPQYIGHIAADPTCFGVTPLDLESCAWLDTQDHLERRVDPTAVEATAVTVTCPIVSVNGQPITPGAW